MKGEFTNLLSRGREIHRGERISTNEVSGLCFDGKDGKEQVRDEERSGFLKVILPLI